MSLPLSLLPPTLLSCAPSLFLSVLPSVSLRLRLSLTPSLPHSLSLPLPPSKCSTPVFLFCISQQSPGQASALNSSTRPCPARLSVCACVCLHHKPLPCTDRRHPDAQTTALCPTCRESDFEKEQLYASEVRLHAHNKYIELEIIRIRNLCAQKTQEK